MKTIKDCLKSQILHSVLVLHNKNMDVLDARLIQLEEQDKNMAEAIRRLLETVNAAKDVI